MGEDDLVRFCKTIVSLIKEYAGIKTNDFNNYIKYLKEKNIDIDYFLSYIFKKDTFPYLLNKVKIYNLNKHNLSQTKKNLRNLSTKYPINQDDYDKEFLWWVI